MESVKTPLFSLVYGKKTIAFLPFYHYNDIYTADLGGFESREEGFMEQEIKGFVAYLHNVKKTSQNTELSYRRDLVKMMPVPARSEDRSAGGRDGDESEFLYIGSRKEGMSAATVSRNIAAMKGFYLYLWKEGIFPRIRRRT